MDRIVIYGLGKWLESRIEQIKVFFEIVGITDKKEEKRWIAEKYGLDFLTIDELKEQKFDAIFIAIREYKQVICELNGIEIFDKSKYIIGPIWWDNSKETVFYHQKYGELNPDKKFMLIRRLNEQVGLFSNFIVFMQYIRLALVKGYIPIIDMKNYANAYLEDEEIGIRNSWESYFVQPYEGVNLDEVYSSQNVILNREIPIPDEDYKYEAVINNSYLRSIYHDIFKKYMKIQPLILDEVECVYKQLFGELQKNGKKICGVLLRGTDYLKFKPYNHPIQPTLEQSISLIREKIEMWGIDMLYVSTEDETILDGIKKTFPGIVLNYDCPRFSINDDESYTDILSLTPYHVFGRENDRYLKGKEYLISMLLMTYCNFFIAGNVSGTIGVLVMKNEFEKEYIFDMGTYGMEDEAILYVPEGNK